MALFDMIKQRFLAIGRSDDDRVADSNVPANADTRTESSSRPRGSVRAVSESIARGLRGEPGGTTTGWFDGPERRQLRVSETADWTGRTTSPQRNGGFAGSSLLDGNYLSTRVLGAPNTQESFPIGPSSENPGGGLFGNDAGASAQGDRGLTGSDLFGSGNDRDDSGRLF
jgi:hypothetical protein